MNNTLNNGFMILEHMANSAEAFSVKEIAEHFQLPNSHACRLLKTLVETGYIEQDKSRKYRISLQVLCLSRACLSRLTVRNKAKAYLYNLLTEAGEEVYLAVPHHGQALIVDVVTAKASNLDTAMTIGNINALHTTACGKLCGAYTHAESEVVGWPEEAATIRAQGYVTLHKPGVFAAAAPVFNFTGNFTAAIGAFFSSKKPEQADCDKLLAKTREAASALSFALGYMSEYR